MLRWIFLGTAVVLAVDYIAFSPKKPTPPQLSSRTGLESPPPLPQNIVQKVGKTRQLYRFADFSECVSVKLHSDVDFYPKGGEVLITPPSPGKPWHDKPGTLEDERGALPPGTYTVCKVGHDAWGIEIWN